MSTTPNRRILVIDDNASIHADYRKILGVDLAGAAAHSSARAAFFGDAAPAKPKSEGGFELESAYQGEEGLERLRAALAAERPYALAFVDVRMPPGIDGVKTARRLWEIDADLQVVICTAFADYSWEELSRELGRNDRLLILKKPFDPIEVVQLATALTEKWNSALRERESIAELRRAEQEARAYAASLATFNRALVSAKAGAEASAAAKAEQDTRLARVLEESSSALLAALERGCEPGTDDRGSRAGLAEANRLCSGILSTARNLALQAGLDRGALRSTSERYSPGELLDALCTRWRGRAQARELRLSCECRGALPASVQGERALVEGVLDALLDNALRFTRAGSVRIEAELPLVEEGEASLIAYRVVDSGPGVPDSERERIFVPLVQGARERADGTGAHYSLATARRLARHLGGDLELDCPQQGGSAFRLILPSGDLSGVEFGMHPPGPLPKVANPRESEESHPGTPRTGSETIL